MTCFMCIPEKRKKEKKRDGAHSSLFLSSAPASIVSQSPLEKRIVGRRHTGQVTLETSSPRLQPTTLQVGPSALNRQQERGLLVPFLCTNGGAMAASQIRPGLLVTLQELHPSSPLFKEGASYRVTGSLQEYTVETAIAIIVDESFSLKIDTQHLRDLNFRVGSIYQFIGELLIKPDREVVLQARVARNVDGMDLNLYNQSLRLLRQFQVDHMNEQTT